MFVYYKTPAQSTSPPTTMFSFFRSSKKSSPVESPEISDANISDDYVLIGQQQDRTHPDQFPNAGIYPSFGPGGPIGPGTQHQPPSDGSSERGKMQRQHSEVFSYLQGVPFKLSPLIRTAGDSDPMEVWSFEVDQILANMTRAMDICAEDD